MGTALKIQRSPEGGAKKRATFSFKRGPLKSGGGGTFFFLSFRPPFFSKCENLLLRSEKDRKRERER